MRSRARKEGAACAAAALHWFTHFVHVHGTQPRRIEPGSWTKPDVIALNDIVRVQCHGDESRALSMIEDIVRARIKGNSLAERYVAYWWHIETGQPKCWQLVPQYVARSIRTCIRRNVAGAA